MLYGRGNKRTEFMKTNKLILMVSIFLTFISCKNIEDKECPQSEKGNDFIQMQGTVCFGTCPAYKLILQETGEVLFIGDMFTKVHGPQRGSIPVEEFKRIQKRIKNSSIFDSVVDSQVKGACPNMATDNPTTFLIYKSGKEVKSYVHYHGCSGSPKFDSLGKIEEEILTSVNARKKWFYEPHERIPRESYEFIGQ